MVECAMRNNSFISKRKDDNMLQELTRKVLTDTALLTGRNAWFEKMRGMFQEGEHQKMKLSGTRGRAVHSELLYTDPEMWMEEVLEDLANRANEAISEDSFVPLCIWGPIYGVHFIDKILGAEVFFQNGEWYNRPLRNTIGELQKPDLERNEVWKLAKKIAQAFLEQKVTVPLFAPPVLSSSLNTAVNLYGEEILITMLLDPEAAEHDLQIINEVIMEIHQWYREHIPTEQLQPCSPAVRTQIPGSGHICGCSTQLLSPELYQQFIFSKDNALLGVYPNGGMIHLCGSHRQLIPLFAQMENLKIVQLNDKAAEELEYYVEGLREDQVIYLYPCEGMPEERALEIADGRSMVIVYWWKE